MKAPVLTLRRADLVAAGACVEWLAAFDEICALRGDDAAPLVRRGGEVHAGSVARGSSAGGDAVR